MIHPAGTPTATTMEVPVTNRAPIATPAPIASTFPSRAFRLVLVSAISGALAVSGASIARAETATVIISDSSPEITSDGAANSAAIELTNLTLESVTLVADPQPEGSTCTFDPVPAILPAGQTTQVVLNLSDTCATDGTLSLALSQSAGAQKIQINAEGAAPSTATDWEPLWAFPIAVGGATFIMLVILWIWLGFRPGAHPFGNGWNPPLPNLPTAYSFGDSLVTNVTLIAGLVTAVLGTGDVLSAFSDEADTALALAAVGGAISAAVIGFAPVLLQMWRRNANTATPVNTAYGLVLATGLTLGASFGLLWVLGKAADSLGISSPAVWIAVSIVAGLILLYGGMNVRNNLEVGADAPPTPPTTPEELIVEAVLMSVDDQRRKDLESMMPDVKDQLSQQYSRNIGGTSPDVARVIVEALQKSAPQGQPVPPAGVAAEVRDMSSVLNDLNELRPRTSVQTVSSPRAALP